MVDRRMPRVPQLVDAATDAHLWAEKYDRDLEDIFAIQDEMTSAIVATLRGRVEAATQDRAKRKPTENMAAYEYVLTGKVLKQAFFKIIERKVQISHEFPGHFGNRRLAVM